jgi:hypothetical protein
MRCVLVNFVTRPFWPFLPFFLPFPGCLGVPASAAVACRPSEHHSQRTDTHVEMMTMRTRSKGLEQVRLWRYYQAVPEVKEL